MAGYGNRPPQCSICESERVIVHCLPCGHVACFLCISHWLRNEEGCAVCLAPILPSSVLTALEQENFILQMPTIRPSPSLKDQQGQISLPWSLKFTSDAVNCAHCGEKNVYRFCVYHRNFLCKMCSFNPGDAMCRRNMRFVMRKKHQEDWEQEGEDRIENTRREKKNMEKDRKGNKRTENEEEEEMDKRWEEQKEEEGKKRIEKVQREGEEEKNRREENQREEEEEGEIDRRGNKRREKEKEEEKNRRGNKRKEKEKEEEKDRRGKKQTEKEEKKRIETKQREDEENSRGKKRKDEEKGAEKDRRWNKRREKEKEEEEDRIRNNRKDEEGEEEEENIRGNKRREEEEGENRTEEEGRRGKKRRGEEEMERRETRREEKEEYRIGKSRRKKDMEDIIENMRREGEGEEEEEQDRLTQIRREKKNLEEKEDWLLHIRTEGTNKTDKRTNATRGTKKTDGRKTTTIQKTNRGRQSTTMEKEKTDKTTTQTQNAQEGEQEEINVGEEKTDWLRKNKEGRDERIKKTNMDVEEQMQGVTEINLETEKRHSNTETTKTQMNAKRKSKEDVTIKTVTRPKTAGRTQTMESVSGKKETASVPKCCVCLEEDSYDGFNNSVLKILPCKHIVCTRCLLHWLTREKGCPLCIAPVFYLPPTPDHLSSQIQKLPNATDDPLWATIPLNLDPKAQPLLISHQQDIGTGSQPKKCERCQDKESEDYCLRHHHLLCGGCSLDTTNDNRCRRLRKVRHHAPVKSASETLLEIVLAAEKSRTEKKTTKRRELPERRVSKMKHIPLASLKPGTKVKLRNSKRGKAEVGVITSNPSSLDRSSNQVDVLWDDGMVCHYHYKQLELAQS